MSLLKTNEIQNYNGSSLTLTASTVSTSAQLNTGGNISVTGSLNVSDDSTTRTNLGLGTIATQDADSITVTGGTATLGALTVSGSDSGDLVRITQTGSGNALVVEDSANPDSTPFVVDSSGNVGVGLTNPGSKLSVIGTTSLDGAVVVNGSGADVDFRIESDTNANAFFVEGSSGNVLIGTTTQGYPTLGYKLGLQSGGSQTYLSIAKSGQTLDSGGMVLGIDAATAYITIRENIDLKFSTNNTVRMTISNTGAVAIVGSLSKGSGSFKIDHPLKSKTDTHHLVHSFVEAPQGDLIYRGKVELVAGRAEVNIDTVAGMTEGTFVALNREVQCFTSNESDWDAVRGSVSGNTLTIECQNAESNATISWLVIGERQDKHMYETEWTDENGKVIVEPLKEIEALETT